MSQATSDQTRANMGGVGVSVAKIDNQEKVLGKAEYIADMSLPNMVHGALLGSVHAHAIIKGYDISKALAAPGVVGIVTGDDLGEGRMGAFIKDEHALAKYKVRYLGEPVAAVAAETESQARAAASLIEIDYEPLPSILSPEAGLADDASILHPDLDQYFKVFDAGSDRNLASRTVFNEGDVDAAWAECDVIVEREYSTQAQAHVAIEPCGALAEMDANGRVTLWSANQSVFRTQANVCESLGLPMTKLRCLTPRIGGGFGNKMEPHVQPATVALAMKCGRPVKLILSREEDFEIVRARHPFQIKMKTGAKQDGTILARECHVIVDCGAYADDSPGVMGYALLMSKGPYDIKNVRAEGKLVYTNKLRFGAFRGFGNPQVTFAGEQQIDEIADLLNIDPIELRRRNLAKQGEPWFLGQTIQSSGLSDCIDAVEAASHWKGRPRSETVDGKTRGRGIAVTAHISGLLSTGAIVRMYEDGTFSLNTGAADIGQGSDTILAQMCAESFKVPLENIAVASPDTDGSPYNWGTTASRVTYMTGRAVVGACEKIKAKIFDQAAVILESEIDQLELRDGGFVGVMGDEERVVPFFVISARAHWAAGGPIMAEHSLAFERDTLDPKRAVAIGLPFPRIGVLSFGACVVDVEVDDVTGQTQVLEAWSALDVGRAINPCLVEVQIEGAFVQGLGYALFEEMVWDGERIANPTLMDYKVPTILDSPYEIHSIIVESPEPDGPFGAKGAGEIGINTIPAVMANAIHAATGFRHCHLPMTSERVLNGLESSQVENPITGTS
ncbi:MAG: CO/xanthine dehydrogenase Mo-binding subunit [Gammaproteobacteria bacterium]|jgi:CO/xanthine dehydrogenase Mo-binding subunit